VKKVTNTKEPIRVAEDHPYRQQVAGMKSLKACLEVTGIALHSQSLDARRAHVVRSRSTLYGTSSEWFEGER
jgi:hypothetical protein